MKGLTIRQPYAERIARGIKRIENRSKPTVYRGELLIHAGINRTWVKAEHIADYPHMTFGAVIAIATLTDCVQLEQMDSTARRDPDANGPFCWFLENVRRLEKPIGWAGAQGLWYVEPNLERLVRSQVAP